jgi:uncharacterized protein YbjT (DUF2867 family)
MLAVAITVGVVTNLIYESHPMTQRGAGLAFSPGGAPKPGNAPADSPESRRARHGRTVPTLPVENLRKETIRHKRESRNIFVERTIGVVPRQRPPKQCALRFTGSIMGVAEDHLTDRSCLTVFGGTGFVGRRVVRHSRESGTRVRIVSRHRGRTEDDGIEQVTADAHDERAVAAAVAGADGVVNAISLYVEHGSNTFHSVHVEAAGKIARAARQAGIRRFVHISGIGANAASPSPYIRSPGEGETAVQTAFPGAVIVRPAVMFASDDAFLTTILRLLRFLPTYPIFGDGQTRLQPVHADDVAAAIAQILRQSQEPYPVYELAGPSVYSYEELLRTIARIVGLRPALVRMPFALWDALAGLAEMLPQPPFTRNQVELMQIDTTASESLPGFRCSGKINQEARYRDYFFFKGLFVKPRCCRVQAKRGRVRDLKSRSRRPVQCDTVRNSCP